MTGAAACQPIYSPLIGRHAVDKRASFRPEGRGLRRIVGGSLCKPHAVHGHIRHESSAPIVNRLHPSETLSADPSSPDIPAKIKNSEGVRAGSGSTATEKPAAANQGTIELMRKLRPHLGHTSTFS